MALAVLAGVLALALLAGDRSSAQTSAELQDVRAEQDDVRDRLAEQNAAIDALIGEVSALRVQEDKVAAELAEQEAELAAARNELATARSELAEARAKLRASIARLCSASAARMSSCSARTASSCSLWAELSVPLTSATARHATSTSNAAATRRAEEREWVCALGMRAPGCEAYGKATVVAAPARVSAFGERMHDALHGRNLPRRHDGCPTSA